MPRPDLDPAAGSKAARTGGQRLATGLIAGAGCLAAVFLVPPDAFFVLALIVFFGAGYEFVTLVRAWAPTTRRSTLLVATALASTVLYGLARWEPATPPAAILLIVGAATAALAAALPTLWTSTPVGEALPAVGGIAFGILYLVPATVSVAVLRLQDPWTLVALLALVWAGDTAAFYIGSHFGRRRLAPILSPRKTWEGAAAGLAAALGVSAAWSLWRLDRLDGAFLGVAAAAAVAAQLGDLLESMLKRGAGVKDSSGLLPGHGGILDRLDGLLLAAPIFTAGVWALGLGHPSP